MDKKVNIPGDSYRDYKTQTIIEDNYKAPLIKRILCNIYIYLPYYIGIGVILFIVGGVKLIVYLENKDNQKIVNTGKNYLLKKSWNNVYVARIGEQYYPPGTGCLGMTHYVLATAEAKDQSVYEISLCCNASINKCRMISANQVKKED